MNPCPTPESLQSLLAGSLAEAEARPARDHLAQCPACQRALDRLAHLPELRAWLADTSPALPPQTPPEIPPFLSRLRDTPLPALLAAGRAPPPAPPPSGFWARRSGKATSAAWGRTGCWPKWAAAAWASSSAPATPP